MADSKIVVFQDKQIRRAWMNEQWYFSIADVVEFLTDSVDVKQYIKRMRQRDPLLNRKRVSKKAKYPLVESDI